MADEDLKSLLAEHLASLGPVHIKRMFGGAGLFLDGLMFGLVSDGVLHLKADDDSRAEFQREGMAPFTYQRLGRPATLLSYWQAPERLLDEPEELRAWAGRAFQAARRQAKPVAPTRARARKPK